VIEVLDYLRTHNPSSHVIALALLPRAWDSEKPYRWPNAFTAGIQIINAALKHHAETDVNITFLDFGNAFLVNGMVGPSGKCKTDCVWTSDALL
jgi:hypothetical protein